MHERGLAFQWQNGYGAFSVGLSQLDKVTAYVRSQPEHHKKMTFEKEFLALLKKADVPYDPNTCSDECRASGARTMLRIDIPALPGWADVWLPALRA
jgi:hypothetical protein